MSEPKFDPVKEFVSLRDSLSKSVSKSIRGISGVLAYPAIDIYETDDSVIVYTEPLPGIDKSSVEVSVEQNRLTITGTTKSFVEVSESAYLHRELHYGQFKREIPLPRRVKANVAKASFKNGVLTITLPKQDTAEDQIVNVTPTEA